MKSKLVTKTTAVLLVVNIILFKNYLSVATIQSSLKMIEESINENNWHLKEVRGEPTGEFTKEERVVEYVYVKKHLTKAVRESLDPDIVIDLVHQKILTGGNDEKKGSVNGRLAKLMSGKLIYGRVKNHEEASLNIW